MKSRRIFSKCVVVLATVIVVVGVVAITALVVHRRAPTPSGGLPPVGHVFVITLENKDYSRTFGPGSAAPYLAKTLASQGVLLSQYYGIGHNSNDNYLAQISGQGPNLATQADCLLFADFVRIATTPSGQARGQGCVYPASVPTVANQLKEHGLSWKAYMEDMGNDPRREPARCAHPAINASDATQAAEVGDQYATRHNPFVYFHSIIDTPDCANRVVPLSVLANDLASVATTPNLTYITPNLCDDGHDSPCVDGQPGGLVTIDGWLRSWVPRILDSPAYHDHGMLVITFDESDGLTSDSSACCGRGPSANSPLPGILGFGGGRVGAVVLSEFVRPSTISNVGYDHYSLLATIEDIFGLKRLGYAATAAPFGPDVFTSYHPGSGPPPTTGTRPTPG